MSTEDKTQSGETLSDNTSTATSQAQVSTLIFMQRLDLTMYFQPSVKPYNSEPPSIFIFNLGRTCTSQINDGPWHGETLLQCFAIALGSINTNGYTVQGAMYSPEGVNIFIETDDEHWAERISINGPRN